MEADRVPLTMNPSNVGTMDTVIIYPRSAGRNLVALSGHNYLILILLPRVIILRISSSAIPSSSTAILSQEEYDRLSHLEFFQNNLSGTHTSASGMHIYTASPQKPWILDSEASSYMTDIK